MTPEEIRKRIAECQPVEGVMPHGDVGTLTEVAYEVLDALEAAKGAAEAGNKSSLRWSNRHAEENAKRKAAEAALEAANEDVRRAQADAQMANARADAEKLAAVAALEAANQEAKDWEDRYDDLLSRCGGVMP